MVYYQVQVSSVTVAVARMDMERSGVVSGTEHV